MDWNTILQFSEAAISIFALINPIGGLPTLVGLTEDMGVAQRRKLLRLAGVTALGVIVAMALVGQVLIDKVFRITIDQFAFAGGLVLMITGIRAMVGGGFAKRAQTSDPATRRDEEISLAVSPIAMPLLVGPGSIVNVMLISQHNGRVFAVLACLAAFVFVILILNYSHLLYRVMGRVGSLAVGRVLQIFIVAIGVKFAFVALGRIFPGLLH